MMTRTSMFVDFFDRKARSFCLLVARFIFTKILFGNNSIFGREIIVMDSDAIEIRRGRISLNGGCIPESDQASGGKTTVFNRVIIEKEAWESFEL